MKSFYLAKILHKARLSSFRKCEIDSTAKVDSECTMTKVVMGRYSYVGSGTRITDAVVGAFTSIGGRCGIGGGIHPTDMVSTSPAFLRGKNILRTNFAQIAYEASKTVVIGNDVWIGEGVHIMSGVTIGNGAVIGAHAVVTSDVAPYTIVAGVPARVIKKRFDDITIDKLQKLEWWSWPDEKLKKYGKDFSSPQQLFDSAEEG